MTISMIRLTAGAIAIAFVLVMCSPLVLGSTDTCSVPLSGTLKPNPNFLTCETAQQFIEGATCSFDCPIGSLLIGGHYSCDSNGEFSGAQSCKPIVTGQNVFTTLSTQGETRLGTAIPPVNDAMSHPPRAAHGIAVCPKSGIMITVGGFDEDSGQSTVSTSVDGIVWTNRGDLLVSGTTYPMWATQAVCDANDKVYVVGGRQEGGPSFTNFEFSTTLTSTGTLTWTKRNAEWQARSYHNAVMVPSSNWMDFLVLAGKITGTMANDVWRYDSSQGIFVQQCGSGMTACGFGIRNSATVAYLDGSTLVMVGGFWADTTNHNVAEEVWISLDDGVSWTLRLATSTALASTTRIRSSLWAYGRILYHGFDGVNGGKNKLSQSTDAGLTWNLVSDDHAPIFPRGDVGYVVKGDSLIAVGGEGPSGVVSDQTVALRVGSITSLSFTDMNGAPIEFNVPLLFGQVFRYGTSLPSQSFVFVEIVLNHPDHKATISVNGHYRSNVVSGTITKVYLHAGQTNLVRVGTPDGTYSFYFTDVTVPAVTTTTLRIPDLAGGADGPQSNAPLTATCSPATGGATSTQSVTYDALLGLYELEYTSSWQPQQVTCTFTRLSMVGFRLPKPLVFWSGTRAVVGFKTMVTSLTNGATDTSGESYLTAPLDIGDTLSVLLTCTPNSLVTVTMTKSALTQTGGYDSATWSLTADSTNTGVATCRLTTTGSVATHFLPSPPVFVRVGTPPSFIWVGGVPSTVRVGSPFKVLIAPSVTVGDRVRFILRCTGDADVTPSKIVFTNSDGTNTKELTITPPSSVGLDHEFHCSPILSDTDAWKYQPPQGFAIELTSPKRARDLWRQRVRGSYAVDRFEVD